MRQPLASFLQNRGVLALGGADGRQFLQGLVSNDVMAAAPDKPLYAALLTPQGKFLNDMFIIDVGDYFLIDCEAGRANDLLQSLAAHKLRAKVTVENVSGAYDVWAAWDGDAPKDWLPDPRLATLGTRVILKKGAQPENIRPASFDDYDRHRLAMGVPDGSRDMIVGKSTLLECNIDRLNGISWQKGCYMGQELTARMHHRGLIKRRLFPVRITGAAPLPGEIVREGGAEVGEMRSSNGYLGLALLDIARAENAHKAGTTFVAAGSQLLVLASPLLPA